MFDKTMVRTLLAMVMVALVAILTGCGKSETKSEEKSPVLGVPKADSPTAAAANDRVSDDVVFRTHFKKFIDEARSLTRTMDLLPDRAAYKNRVNSVEEAYSRIPDPPSGNEALAMCCKSARQISANFQVGDVYLGYTNDFLHLGSRDGADKSLKHFHDLGKQQRVDLDELEAAVKDGRVPKIELSDVIKGKDLQNNSPKPPIAKVEAPTTDDGSTDALKELLKVVERDGTPTRVTDFKKPGHWQKRHYTATRIEYHVKKTDSLVSPCLATVSWLEDAYLSQERATKREAEADPLPKQPTAGSHSTPFWAKLAWQGGKWVLQDVGWELPSFDIYRSHTKTSNPKDPVHDWWVAFGGTDDFSAREAEAENRENAEVEKKREQRAAEEMAKKERKAATEAAKWHTWTDLKGRTIEAKFTGMMAGNVKLTKRDGTVLTLPLEKLSDEDQEWIKNRKK